MSRESGEAVGHVSLERGLQQARPRVRRFLDELDPEGRLVVFCHNDADGLSAGAVFARGLASVGFGDIEVVPSLRSEGTFSTEARARLRALRPDALIVTDLGIDRAGLLAGVPTLYVDHHHPSGFPAEAVSVSGYGWDPVPTSSWMALELLRPLVDVDELEWIAAVGVVGDLGAGAPWPRLADIRKRYTARWIQEAVVLINAARRAPAFDVDTPLRILMQAEHPRELSERDDLGADRLHAYRADVNAELARARRHAPVFSDSEPFALISLHSAAQVHPLIAQQWRGRLPKYAAIAANTGYLPGMVAFSVRTAREDLVLPEILQAVELGEVDGRYGKGHDQASGGHLPPGAFRRLLAELGFADEAVENSLEGAEP